MRNFLGRLMAIVLLMMAVGEVNAQRERQDRGSDRPDRGGERGDRGPEEGGRRGRGRGFEEGRGRGGYEGGRGGGRGRMITPLMEALDTDGDGEISKLEIKGAIKHLRALDQNGDGKLSGEEIAPPRGPGGPGGPGGGPGGPPDAAAMIERMDQDGDGKLQIDELPEFMASRMAAADTDDDGILSEDEITSAMENMRGRRGGRGRGAMDAAGMMERFDRNGDGQLSIDEVPDRVAEMMNDANNDGLISVEEMKASMETMRERFAGGGRGGRGREGRGAGPGGEGGRRGEGRRRPEVE